MKKAFNTYVSVVFVLLLGAFANIHANHISSNTAQIFIAKSDALQISLIKVSNQSNTSVSYNPLQKETRHRLLFDIADVDEVENEESTDIGELHKTNGQNTAFINSQLFDSFSKELQKNLQRSQSIVHKPSVRLHLRFQVFII